MPRDKVLLKVAVRLCEVPLMAVAAGAFYLGGKQCVLQVDVLNGCLLTLS